jgi:hypothetical protein
MYICVWHILWCWALGNLATLTLCVSRFRREIYTNTINVCPPQESNIVGVGGAVAQTELWIIMLFLQVNDAAVWYKTSYIWSKGFYVRKGDVREERVDTPLACCVWMAGSSGHGSYLERSPHVFSCKIRRCQCFYWIFFNISVSFYAMRYQQINIL